MLISIALAAILGLVSAVTAGSRQHKSVSAMSAIRRCPSCGQVVASGATTCRHCGAD
ncbi:MAG: zinc ribbon domain-containing protein [Ilumatobacteraceae bacterium]